jgi:hypothetical protein
MYETKNETNSDLVTSGERQVQTIGPSASGAESQGGLGAPNRLLRYRHHRATGMARRGQANGDHQDRW